MPASAFRHTALALALAAALGSLGCSQSVESLVAGGEAAVAKGDYRTAAIQLKSALQKDGNNARARWLLGEVALATEEGAAAEKEILRAGELGVGSDAVVPALAQALLLQGKFDEVLALEVPPTLSPRARGEVLAAQAVALLGTGDRARADELATQALSLAPDARFAMLARARVLAAAKQLDQAEELLAAVQQRFPDYGLAWSLLGDLKNLRGDLPKAEEAYTAAIAKRPNNGPDLLKRAFVRLRQQNPDGALADAEKLVKQLPNLQAAWYVAGSAHLQKKDYPKAQEALDRAFQLDSNDLAALILLGWTNLQVGNLSQAAEQANRALELAPNVVGARLLTATLDLREGRAKRAEEMVRPVVSAYPDNLPAKGLLASSLQAQGRGAEAAPLLEQIAAARPESTDIQAAVGLQLLRAGEGEKASAVLEQAAARAPESPEITMARVVALVKEGKLDEALATARTFREQNPDDLAAQWLLAGVQGAKGDYAGAEQTFRRALDIAPGDVRSSLGLADLLRHRGDHAGVRAVLEAAAARHPQDQQLAVVMAQIAAQEGRADDARALLAKAVELAPQAVVPRLLLGRQLLAEKNPQGALDVLPKDPDTKDPAVLATRAEAALQLGQLARARDDLERLVGLAPGSAAVHFRLATIYGQLGQAQKMEAALDEAARLVPGDATVGLARARAQAARGDVAQAERTIAALGLGESEPGLLEARLFVASRKGDRPEQVRLAKALFEARPQATTALGLAEAQLAAGSAADAEQTLADWAAKHPEDAAVALALAQRYGETGRPAEAADLLRPVVARNPGDAALLNNLAWYLRDVAPAEALAFAERAQAAVPDNAAILDTYAAVLARNGQIAKAFRAIDRAIELSSGSAYLRVQRIELLVLAGDQARAAEELAALDPGALVPSLRDRVDSLRARVSASPN
jgi:putative PEP-CTERM system TPR-repeat lipoprotein